MKPVQVFLSLQASSRVAALIGLLAIIPASGVFAQQNSQGTKTSSYQFKTTIQVPKGSQTTILPDGRTIFNTADKMPEFKGDMTAFLGSNLKYPEAARAQKAQGRSVVKFIVNSDGRVSDATIVKSSGNALLDAEALRVTGLMQDWNPGIQKGHPVDVFFHLPVSYKLD